MDRRRGQRKRTSKDVDDSKPDVDRRQNERRQERRVAAEIMVEVETSGVRTYRRTANISAGGVGFHQPIPFSLGSTVNLSLKLAGRGSAMRVTGEVVGADKNGRGNRVRFVKVSDKARKALDEHLQLFSVPTKIGQPPAPLPAEGRERERVREGILIVEDDERGLEFRLRGTDKIIGRDPKEVDFVIEHISISRRHAHIYMQNGRHVVMDLGSTNGLHFRGKQVHHLVLRSGMVFKVGNVRLQYLVTKTV